MSYKRLCGIYLIRNIRNGKVYIGSSLHMKNRWRDHRYDLKRNNHDSLHLQASWNKYGRDNFEFSIVELCPEDSLLDKESYWIKLHNSIDSSCGYNGIMPGDYHKSRPDILMKQSKPIKIVVCINKITGLTEEGYRPHLSRELSIPCQKITDCCKYWKKKIGPGLKKSIRGYIFVYKEDYEPEFDYINHNIRGKNHLWRTILPKKTHSFRKNPEDIIPHSQRNYKRTPILATHIQSGTETSFTSIQDCIRKLKLASRKVREILNHKPWRTHHGYTFKVKSTSLL